MIWNLGCKVSPLVESIFLLDKAVDLTLHLFFLLLIQTAETSLWGHTYMTSTLRGEGG